MRVVLFGTYDVRSHPRVEVLAQGLRAGGVEVVECNEPLGLNTAARVALLRQPWRLPLLALRLAGCWWRLALASRRVGRVDAVLVGYLGHFDVHLARLLFPRRPVFLDHLISAGDTARDRGVTDVRARLLLGVDAAAVRAARVVLVDTEEHRQLLAPSRRDSALVVPVGATQEWFDAGALRAQAPETLGTPPAGGVPAGHSLSVVFFGLFTPLQGAPVIGAALRELAGAPVRVTMVGSGQDLEATRAAAGAGGAPDSAVRWLDWVAPDELAELVSGHDVCLGIFGTGPKALRVVPNKIYQGAAAGTALVTSDTPPQRRALGQAAVFVPPGDAHALAAALSRLAADPAELADLRARARALAVADFAPLAVTAGLRARLAELAAR